MRNVDNNRAENFIKKHDNFKKWVIFALCISLITGTVTLYMMNKPATAMTEEGAQQIGLVLETADAEFEQGIIEQMESDEASAEGALVGEEVAYEDAAQGEASVEVTDESDSASSLDSILAEGEELAADSAASLGSSLTEEALAAASLGSSLTEEEMAAAANSAASLASTLEEDTALLQDVVLTVAYLDQDGQALADEREINLSESINFTEEAREIEGYLFQYALIDGIEIQVITAKLDENEHKYYEATLADGTTVTITENAIVALVYKSSALTEETVEKEVIEYIPKVSLKGTLVDDFGTEIDVEKYSKIDLPSFEEELMLGDTENPPYKNVKVKTGVFKYNIYSYVKATYDGKVITGIKKEEVEGVVRKADEAADATDASSDAASEASTEASSTDASTSDASTSQETAEAEKEIVTVYYYTTDGNEYTRFEEDAIINFVYTTGDQTEYRYEDEKVSIVAKLQKPGAIPEEAELQITQITSDTTGYNYNAYMSALNDNAEAIATAAGHDEAGTYDDSNTLMYDIAFMYEGEEIQPAEGAVSISLEFKNNQLSNDLSVVTEEDVTVVHLPIKEEVKEQSEITSTSEATGITSGDIEVKTLSDATTELDGVEKVEFSEDNFSVFVFVSGTSLRNTWNGKKNVTLNDFSEIASLLNYSIVANEFTNNGHLEGNVRVGTLYINKEGSDLNSATNRISKNPITEINVVKTVVNGSDGPFKFAFFNEYNAQVGPTFEISTQNKTGTKQILNNDGTFADVFNALNNGATLYVYELREDGSPAKEGEKNKDYTVTYTYTDILGYDVDEIANDHDANYIGEFESSTGGTVKIVPHTFGTTENYVGEYYQKNGSDYYFGYDQDVYVHDGWDDLFIYTDDLKATIGKDIDSAKSVSVSLADAMNYASGNNNVSNIVNVLNIVSTTGTLSSDLAAANLASPYISGLINSDQYLLINIAVNEWSFGTYNIDGQSVNYDGQNPQNHYSPLASHIIYNFVNADRTASYGGTVKITSWSDGLILAPAATVDQTNAYFQGEIIGNVVKHEEGNELHKKTFTSGKEVTVNVLNTADGGLVVYKQVNGEPATATYDGKFRFTIERYQGSGRWTDITEQVSPGGITNQYDNETGLSMMAIPLPTLTNGKTEYFRIHEDAGTTYSGLTNDTSYIYAKVEVSSTGSITSIKYYKVRGDYRDLNSPYNAIDRSGSTEVAGSDVAFNNTSAKTSLVVTKNWVGGDKWAYVYAYVCGRSGSNDVYGAVIQLSEQNDWTATVEDLPAYDADGTPIIYRALEIGQVVGSVEEIQYGIDGKPANLLYDGNAVNTQSDEYQGYTASYSTDLSESDILYALGRPEVTAPERVGAVGELSGTVTITNTYNYKNVTLSLFKYLDGKDPAETTFEFSVSALKNDYSLTEPETVTNIGNSISYTTKIENNYVITKESNQEKNVYFLIKEKDISSDQFTKDESYIIAKVKKLGTDEQYVNYYRVSDSAEKAEIDNNAQKIVAYANSEHSINDSADVAFYNTSYSIKIRKEWVEADGTEIPKDVYDTYTAVNIAVWQTYRGGTPVIYETVTLSAANNWEYTINNVPRKWKANNGDHGQYVYYIQEYDNYGELKAESPLVAYYKEVDGEKSERTNVIAKVDIRTGEDDGEMVLVCQNIKSDVVLPETGGVGTAVYVLIGLAIIALAAMGLIFAGKRARRA